MELTKDKAVRLHRELWGWLADNPNKQKWDWPEWKVMGGGMGFIDNYCFCCAYAGDTLDGERKNCKNCLLVWPGESCQYSSDDETDENMYGLFEEWISVRTDKKRSKLAKQIRDLPVRED